MMLAWMRRCGALCVLLGLLLAVAQAAQGDVLTQDTRLETAGGAAFTAPEGWRTDTRGDALILAPPEAGSTIVFMEVDAADGDAAVAEAWRRSGLELQWPVKVASDQAAADGWEQVRVVQYEVPENARRYVSGSARLAGERWTVALIDFHLPDLDRRRGQVGLIFSSLMPKGHERESFAGRTANKLDEARLAQLVSFVEHAQRELQIPGIGLGVVQDGKVVLAKGLGVRDVESGEPVDADTLFMVASNTKAMTTLLLARLVDAGKVRWDTPVVDVFPSFRLGDAETTRKVQVQHLVCACTGLPRQDAEWLTEFADATPETVVAGLANMQPTTGFGALYQYSNPLAAAGGFIGGHVAHPRLPLGEAYDRAMQEQVFDPLGMRRTTFDFATVTRGNHAGGYGLGLDGRIEPALTDINPSIVPMRPTGGAWSNLDDMLRFVQFELDRGLLPDGSRHVSEAALLERREPKVALGKDAIYGMGLMVDRTWGVPVVYHGGSMIGYKSGMLWLPDYGVGMVILTNSEEGQLLMFPLGRYLQEVLLDGQPQARAQLDAAIAQWRAARAAERERLQVPADAAVVSALATAYGDGGSLGRLDIVRDGGRTVFDFGEWKSEVASRRNEDGTTSFVLTGPGMLGWQFVVADEDGKRGLVARTAQQEYLLQEVAD